MPAHGVHDRAAERAGAEDRRDQPERLGAPVQRPVGDERQQHVEVEANVESTSTAKNATPARRECTTKRRASSAPPTTVAPWSRIGRCSIETSSASSAGSSARKLPELTAERNAGSREGDDTPPIAGPRMRASVPRLELSATAFCEVARGRPSGTRARAAPARRPPGRSPCSDARAVDLPDGDDARERQGREHRRDHERATTPSRGRRGGRRSGRGACRRRGRGPSPAAAGSSASAPTATGECVSCRRSQDAAICCTHVPGERDGLPAEVEAVVAVLADARESSAARAPCSQQSGSLDRLTEDEDASRRPRSPGSSG